MINISKGELKELLLKAFDEGYHGPKSFKEDVAEDLLDKAQDLSNKNSESENIQTGRSGWTITHSDGSFVPSLGISTSSDDRQFNSLYQQSPPVPGESQEATRSRNALERAQQRRDRIFSQQNLPPRSYFNDLNRAMVNEIDQEELTTIMSPVSPATGGSQPPVENQDIRQHEYEYINVPPFPLPPLPEREETQLPDNAGGDP